MTKKRIRTPEQEARRRAYLVVWGKAWRAKNPEKVKAQNAKQRARHGAKYLAAEKEFRKNHPVEARVLSRKRYWRSRPARLRAMKRYRTKHQAKERLRCSQWTKSNMATARAANQRRRAIKKKATVEDCRAKIQFLSKERFCHWCCKPLTHGTYKDQQLSSFTVDHVIPLITGGLHTPDNLVAACYSCNSSKGTKLVSEWTWTPYEEAA